MSLRVLILSDSHLFQSKSKELFGVGTYRALDVTVAHIRNRRERFDLMVALGDLSEDGSKEAYRNFEALTSGLADSVIWVRGNHDRFDLLDGEQTTPYCQPEWHSGPWHLIFLDTTLRGRDEGRLAADEMERLGRFLSTYRDGHILVFMHHQPVPVGSAFIDELALQNREQFLKIVSGHHQIKGIIFGHVHQLVDVQVDQLRMLSVPATSVQFRPHSEQLDFDQLRHGYRIVTLSPDGQLDTSVEMVDPG